MYGPAIKDSSNFIDIIVFLKNIYINFLVGIIWLLKEESFLVNGV